MRIGIFGGSFDPPHKGHIKVAERVMRRRLLDEVIFVPARQPPHKSGRILTDCSHRTAMLRLAVASEPAFKVDDIECRRGGVSYTIDTLLYFRNKYPASELFFIIGSDSLEELPFWHRIKEAINIARFVTVLRSGFNEEVFERLSSFFGEKKVAELRADMLYEPPIEVSSTEARQRLMDGKPVTELLDKRVLEYISEKKLYR